ncbi:MAG: MFS transporter, partial [Actinomycetes bacterium]
MARARPHRGTIAAPICGLVTQHLGLRVAILTAAALVAVSAVGGLVLKVPENQHLDRTPLAYWGVVPVALEPDPGAGPIVVSIEYEVSPEYE